MYLDDPTVLIAAAEETWGGYLERGNQLIVEASAKVVDRRYTEESEILPDHPFWRTFDATDGTDIWPPRPMQWIQPMPEHQYVRQHGFDAQGRIVLVTSGLRSLIVVFGEGHYDILLKFHQMEVGRMHSSEQPPDGARLGGFRRFCRRPRANHRIAQTYTAHRTSHALSEFRTLPLEGDRLVESFWQWFCRSPGQGRKDSNSPDPRVRRVNEHLWEPAYMRHRVEYTYGDDGSLTSADVFDGLSGKYERSLYARNSSETIESTVEEMAPLLAKAIVKLVNDRKEARPVKRVALLYLRTFTVGCRRTPTLASHDVITDTLRQDPYPHLTSWPEGRTKKIGSCFARLMQLVEGNPLYADDCQPRPYRELMWRTSRAIYDKLVGSKHVVSGDFAVYPVDQNGDVDAAEDIRQSLPPEVAERVIRELQV
jgi:hypothetical protein